MWNMMVTIKAFLVASLLVVAVRASFEEQKAQFQAFKLKHSKNYDDQVEETKRFAIFNNNLRSIEEHNALYGQGKVSYKQAINKFSDMTQEEFRARLNVHPIPTTTLKTERYVRTGVAVPASVDWRSEGLVSGVKDQGMCSSCWAFSITGSTEGAYARKSGTLVSLSEQQLIDCDTTNAGCKDGYLEPTLDYVKSDGLQSETSYPYIAQNGTCQYNASAVVTKVSSYKGMYGNETDLLEAVGTVGPVSAAMDASWLSGYDSGVYTAGTLCSIYGLNHYVLVVGYGNEDGQDYWLIKNSWGYDWGEDGYLKLLRGTNECGIAQHTIYPIIE